MAVGWAFRVGNKVAHPTLPILLCVRVGNTVAHATRMENRMGGERYDNPIQEEPATNKFWLSYRWECV